MSTGKRLVAAALGGACLAAAAPSMVGSAGAEEPMALTMAPMRAQSLDVGPKHIVAYFLGDGSQCRLTLMIVDVGDDTTFLASRLQLVVDAGRSASLDTAHGASLSFDCDNRARAMRVTRIDRFTGAHHVE